MEPFKGSTGFCYNPGPEPMGEGEGEGEGDAFSGMLDIYAHHARNIHNICIYDNQDVYAKFSLTCSPDEALSTRVVHGGGKNPRFDESLRIKVAQPDAVLKCEIWMLSRVRNYLEDQLLGFALVPLSSIIAAKGKLTQDFTLSSTDLFHSPAGTVQLTLSLDTSLDSSDELFSASTPNTSSISSEVVLLDPQVEYSRIEFPDINISRENQQMVSQYFDMTAQSCPQRTIAACPFLHLGASSQSMEDYDMTALNSGNENRGDCVSPDGSYQNSGLFSSTATSLSDDRNSADSLEKKSQEAFNRSHVEVNQSSGALPVTPTSKNMDQRSDEESKISSKEEKENGGKEHALGPGGELGSVFKSPLGNINLEAEQSEMQQQIVDMYMRSMQQFTESLAKMKLPMDLNNPNTEDGGDVIQIQNNRLDAKTKKDGPRVFYGSRAFF